MFISILKSTAIEYLISVPTLKNKKDPLKRLKLKLKMIKEFILSKGTEFLPQIQFLYLCNPKS